MFGFGPFVILFVWILVVSLLLSVSVSVFRRPTHLIDESLSSKRPNPSVHSAGSQVDVDERHSQETWRFQYLHQPHPSPCEVPRCTVGVVPGGVMRGDVPDGTPGELVDGTGPVETVGRENVVTPTSVVHRVPTRKPSRRP